MASFEDTFRSSLCGWQKEELQVCEYTMFKGHSQRDEGLSLSMEMSDPQQMGDCENGVRPQM